MERAIFLQVGTPEYNEILKAAGEAGFKAGFELGQRMSKTEPATFVWTLS